MVKISKNYSTSAPPIHVPPTHAHPTTAPPTPNPAPPNPAPLTPAAPNPAPLILYPLLSIPTPALLPTLNLISLYRLFYELWSQSATTDDCW